jgi:cytochrome P450
MATPEITGYRAVRAAARDHEAYSSDLQGDRDVRDYRQLPLEADPPRHDRFRVALEPYFNRTAIEPHVPAFTDLAHRLIDDISANGGGELVHDLALPYVMGCLAIIYDRPQDVDEWISWGPDVWTAEAYQKGEITSESLDLGRNRDFSVPSQRSGRVLEEYLTRVFDTAQQREKDGTDEADVWDHVQRLQIEGEPLSRAEKFGIANVLLAGGRDTVIKMTTGLTWHLINTPADRIYLTQEPEARPRAFAELARYLSPLPKIERMVPERRGDGPEPDRESYVLLNWASANHDQSVWPDADRIDIRRERNPHVAFGFGRHSCLGVNITEHEINAYLAALLERWPEWVLDGEPDISWVDEHGTPFLDRFDRVPVRVQA